LDTQKCRGEPQTSLGKETARRQKGERKLDRMIVRGKRKGGALNFLSGEKLKPEVWEQQERDYEQRLVWREYSGEKGENKYLS